MDLIENTQEVGDRALQELESVENSEQLDSFYARFLAKKGEIPGLMSKMREVPGELRAAFGKKVNDIRDLVTQKFEARKAEMQKLLLEKKLREEQIDISLPASSPAVMILSTVFLSPAAMDWP